MAEKTTFIKIDRNIMRWGWYTDANTAHLFIHLILKANIEEHKFRDMVVKRGQLFTSLPHLANETGMTVNEVRTALKHLTSTGEITDESQPFGRLISVVSYNLYQDKPTDKRTGKSQADHRQATDESQQSKNNKKDKNEKKESAPATPDGGGRAEWEIRRKLPDNLVGHFDTEEQFDSWLSGEGYDPH